MGRIPDVGGRDRPDAAAMSTHTSPTTGSGAAQAELWGPRPRAWAFGMEPQMRPVYEAVLDRIGAGDGTELLDAGCGSGFAAQLAAGRGAVVNGLDATPELLEIARERVPNGEFAQGDLESLPYADDTFDAVVGFNSFQYAASPRAALEEARRVARPGAPVAFVTWAVPEHCPAAIYIAALGSQMPAPPPGAPGPFALSAPGALEALAREAGLTPGDADDVPCHWTWPDLEQTLRAMLSAGPAVKAIRHSGEEAVSEAVTNAIAPFRTDSGGYDVGAAFRYLITAA
jgi:SAM-dependent methyltransferase